MQCYRVYENGETALAERSKICPTGGWAYGGSGINLNHRRTLFPREGGEWVYKPHHRALQHPHQTHQLFYLPSPSTMTTTKATYTAVGSSGLRISNPILGAMSYGSPTWLPWCLDSAAALPLLKSAYDQGINTWDTSGNYSNGLSERIIAQAVKTYAIPRENLVIMTKCYFFVDGELVTPGGGL